MISSEEQKKQRIRYKTFPFTDTNSVNCKNNVGADAYIRPWVDVGIDPYDYEKEKDI